MVKLGVIHLSGLVGGLVRSAPLSGGVESTTVGRCSAIWTRKAGGKYFGGGKNGINPSNSEVVPSLAQVVEGDENSVAWRCERVKSADVDWGDSVFAHVLQDCNDIGISVDNDVRIKRGVEPEDWMLTEGPFVLEYSPFLGLVEDGIHRSNYSPLGEAYLLEAEDDES